MRLELRCHVSRQKYVGRLFHIELSAPSECLVVGVDESAWVEMLIKCFQLLEQFDAIHSWHLEIYHQKCDRLNILNVGAIGLQNDSILDRLNTCF